MHDTIKKKLQLHTYMDSNYTLSFFYFVILISFGYTRVYSFFFIYWVFDDLFILNALSFVPH